MPHRFILVGFLLHRIYCSETKASRTAPPWPSRRHTGGALSQVDREVGPVKVNGHLWVAAHIPEGQKGCSATKSDFKQARFAFRDGLGCASCWVQGKGFRAIARCRGGFHMPLPPGPISQCTAIGCHESASVQKRSGMARSPSVSGRPPCVCAKTPRSPEGHLGHRETQNPWRVCTAKSWMYREDQG